MDERKYYEAYDDRYRQIHSRQLSWFTQTPTPIVGEVLCRYGIGKGVSMLELGCGEGRDAADLLNRGYALTATDVSPEAISWCRERNPVYSSHFQVLDCLKAGYGGQFAFIYAISVLHMLVQDGDRSGFYRFFRDCLAPGGIGLITTMGDGESAFATDISAAFALQPRRHGLTGAQVSVAGTSCRVVTMDTFVRETADNGLEILEKGLTHAEPDFPIMLYAVVKKQ